jgi:hypothetical protein
MRPLFLKILELTAGKIGAILTINKALFFRTSPEFTVPAVRTQYVRSASLTKNLFFFGFKHRCESFKFINIIIFSRDLNSCRPHPASAPAT